MKRKKPKKVIKYGIIIFLFLFVFYNHNSIIMIKRVFGITYRKYKVVNVDNSLKYFSENGSCEVELEIEEKRMESFLKSIEKRYGKGQTKKQIEEYEGSLEQIVAKNVTGREATEEDVIIVRPANPARTIINPFVGRIKTAQVSIVYCPIENGKYRVWLDYSE